MDYKSVNQGSKSDKVTQALRLMQTRARIGDRGELRMRRDAQGMFLPQVRQLTRDLNR